MFGAIAKSYYAQKLGKSAKDIFCVSVMPCVAKKYEAATPEVSDVADQDVDVVLTTRELDRMLRAMQINVAALPEEDFDSPLGRGSGACLLYTSQGLPGRAPLHLAHLCGISLSGHVLWISHAQPGLFLCLSHADEPVHLRRLHGIRDGQPVSYTHLVDETRGRRGLTGHPARGVLGQDGVQHRIGDLVANFVGMSFCYGLGCKKSVAHWERVLLHINNLSFIPCFRCV